MLYDLGSSGAATTWDRLKAANGVRCVPDSRLQQAFVPKFCDDQSCAALIDRIDAAVRPSTITDDIGDPEFRTSQTGDLNHGDPVVAALDARLAELTGIDPACGEPLQGQRYDAGQQFKDHTDYFEPMGIDYEPHTRVSGQRTWTAMLYLNSVEAGGATRFASIERTYQPERGKLLLWCNLTPEGQPNPWTLHHAMKVRKGRKYVITKWYRERPWPWPNGAPG